MPSVEELISQTKSLLETLENVKARLHEADNRSKRPRRRATSHSSAQHASNDSVRVCQRLLKELVSNANVLLQGLSSDLTVESQFTGQDSARTQSDAPSNPLSTSVQTHSTRDNPPGQIVERSPLRPLEIRPSESVSTIPDSTHDAQRRDKLSETQLEVDNEEQGNIESGQETVHNHTAENNENTPRSSWLRDPVEVTTFKMAQMRAAMVPQLEALSQQTPNRCYDKIRIVDFAAPDFSPNQPPASNYMRGSRFVKDGLRLRACMAESGFKFPSTLELNKECQSTSIRGIRLFFMRVFDAPPSDILPYFVGPIPMPDGEYEPLVHAGPRLCRRNAGNLPGVNTPFWYISQAEKTPATLHVEDGDLGSVNLVLAGAPKLWLLIPASEKSKLESCVKELFSPEHFACSQQIRHYNALVSPKLLETWKIAYFLDSCEPGEMIVTRPNTYHQVLNLGVNIAESINIEFSDTRDMPLDYIWCKKGRAACGKTAMTAHDFALSREPHTTKSNMKRSSASTEKSRKVPKRKSHTGPNSACVETSKDAIQDTMYGRFTFAQIHRKFTSRLSTTSDNAIAGFLTRLFFVIGSAEAVIQLKHACRLCRDSNSRRFFVKGATSADAMRALDLVDDAQSSLSIVRRWHLVSLIRRRDCLIEQHKSSRNLARTRNDGAQRVQRVESLALDDLHQEAFGAAESQSRRLRTKLENRLRHGRNWSALVDRFSVGILALVPTGQDLDITNPQLERITQVNFFVLLNILDEERGSYLRNMSASVDGIYEEVLFDPRPSQLYQFEDLDRQTFEEANFDSEDLVKYCAKVES